MLLNLNRVIEKPSDIVDDLRHLEDLGYRHVIVRYRGNDAEEQRKQLGIFLADIMPKV